MVINAGRIAELSQTILSHTDANTGLQSQIKEATENYAPLKDQLTGALSVYGLIIELLGWMRELNSVQGIAVYTMIGSIPEKANDATDLMHAITAWQKSVGITVQDQLERDHLLDVKIELLMTYLNRHRNEFYFTDLLDNITEEAKQIISELIKPMPDNESLYTPLKTVRTVVGRLLKLELSLLLDDGDVRLAVIERLWNHKFYSQLAGGNGVTIKKINILGGNKEGLFRMIIDSLKGNESMKERALHTLIDKAIDDYIDQLKQAVKSTPPPVTPPIKETIGARIDGIKKQIHDEFGDTSSENRRMRINAAKLNALIAQLKDGDSTQLKKQILRNNIYKIGLARESQPVWIVQLNELLAEITINQ